MDFKCKLILFCDFNNKKEKKFVENIFCRLYDEFCVNTNDLFVERLYYEIYKYTDIDKLEFDMKSDKINVEKDLFICFISDKIVADKNAMRNLSNISHKFKNILPISFTRNGIKVLDNINILFIKFQEEINEIIYFNKDNFESETEKVLAIVAANIIYIANNKEKKLKLFLSYARNESIDMINIFVEKINGLNCVEPFLDTQNIPYGSNFQIVLMENLKEACVIALVGNLYPTRYWCLKEIIFAKNYKLPTVLADISNGLNKRINPNIGNIPSVKIIKTLDSTIYQCIFTVLKEQLKKIIFSKYEYNNDLVIWKKPELYDLIMAHNSKKNKSISYPDPPLNLAEKEHYSEVYSDIQLNTHIEHFILPNLTSNSFSICLSSSNTDTDSKLHNLIAENLFIELCRYFLINNIKINYGGDWRKGGLTEKITKLISAYLQYSESIQKNIFKNFYVEKKAKANNNTLLANAANEFIIEEINQPSKKGLSKFEYAIQLSKMRQKLIKNSSAVIFIGGKIKLGSSFTNGIVEELYQALLLDKPVFIVGGLGGCSGIIADAIINNKKSLFKLNNRIEIPKNKKSTYDNLIVEMNTKLDEIGLKNYNTLTYEENKILLTSSNLEKIMMLIFKGLEKIDTY